MKKIVRTIFSMLLAAAIPALAADGIAFLSNLKGEVAIDGNSRPTLLAEITRGQRISVGNDSHAAAHQMKESNVAGEKQYTASGMRIFGCDPNRSRIKR